MLPSIYRRPVHLLVALLFAAGADARTEIVLGQLDMAATGLPDAPVAVTLSGDQLAAASPDADASTAALLGQLSAVHLRQYPGPDAATIAAAQALPDSLEAAAWQPVRSDVDDGRQVHLLARRSPTGTVAGLVLLVIDPGKLVAIANIVGDIPPAQLGQLGLPLAP